MKNKMNIKDIKTLEEAYDDVLIQENLVKILGNLAVTVYRYVKNLIQRNPETASLIVRQLAEWIKQNSEKIEAKQIDNIIKQSEDPDKSIVNVYQFLRSYH